MFSLLQMRIQESLYDVILSDWLRIIPRDQFIFLRFEDYVNNKTHELKKVHAFLGLG